MMLIQFQAFPLAYGFLEGKSTEEYTLFLSNLKKECGISPLFIYSDFETSLIAGSNTVFPNSRHCPCWFHFSKVYKNNCLFMLPDDLLEYFLVYY